MKYAAERQKATAFIKTHQGAKLKLVAHIPEDEADGMQLYTTPSYAADQDSTDGLIVEIMMMMMALEGLDGDYFNQIKLLVHEFLDWANYKHKEGIRT